MIKQPAEKKIDGLYVALPRAELGGGMCGSKRACSAAEVTALLPVLLRKAQSTKNSILVCKCIRTISESSQGGSSCRLPQAVTDELAAAHTMAVGPCQYLKNPGGNFVRRYTAVIMPE